MSSTADSLATPEQGAARYGALDRLLRQRLLATLDGLDGGRVLLVDALGTVELGRPGGLEVRIDVLDPGFYRAAAAQGSVGAGEAYMDGLWRCD
ncbi:MAG: SAM-dependent methyltransferase, partial [Arenimonas sp.]|nr:SAM-dependent methyltransferase [Arenimonas sp.]